MKWEAAAVTDTGQRRRNNEDAVLMREDLGLFVVADGMGGHVAGEVASRLAVAAVAEEVEAAADALAEPRGAERVLVAAAHAANRRVLNEAERDPRRSGMGTTLTAALLAPDARFVRIAHVGDSRAYQWREGTLSQLTRDHTWVQQQVDLGLLTPAQARNHEASAVLAQAVGIAPTIAVDVVSADLRSGDTLLLCSDGLSGVLEDHQLAELLSPTAPAAEVAAALVAAANRGGGPDNITVVVIRFT